MVALDVSVAYFPVEMGEVKVAGFALQRPVRLERRCFLALNQPTVALTNSVLPVQDAPLEDFLFAFFGVRRNVAGADSSPNLCRSLR